MHKWEQEKRSENRKNVSICCRGGACPSRRYTADSHRLSIKRHVPIASVAALTAQPLAALPPYGCGVPLAGCERHAGPGFGGTIADRTHLVGGGVLDATPRKVTVFAGTCLLSNMVLRDCRVASLLAMTHQAGAAVTTVHPIKLVLLIAASRAWLSPPLH